MLQVVVVVLLIALLPSLAQAEARIALLIGNQRYATEVGPLKNPLNDIHIVGAALAKVGFEVMTPVQDADRGRILRAAYDFAGRLQTAGSEAVGFLYYSGHGVAVDGDNFLIPIDVKSTTRRELDVEGIRLTDIINILNDRAPKAVHFVVFDACRNNLGGVRGAKGFVPVAEKPGMLIAFSTAPGTTASDQGENSGPYARALAAELVRPGNHSDLFFELRTRVATSTAHEQIPWTQDGLMRRVYFGDRGGMPVGPPPRPPQPVTPPIAAPPVSDRRLHNPECGTINRPELNTSFSSREDTCRARSDCEWVPESLDARGWANAFCRAKRN